MSAKSVVAALTGFLAHHVADLSAIHAALSELTSVAPIDSQDKDRINSVLKTVQSSVEHITEFLNGSKLSESNVTLKESDIVEALGNFFKSPDGVEALRKAALSSAEGNANG